MKNIWDELREPLKTIQRWSTKKKILALIVIWALIFVPSVAIYTSIHRESSFSFYPEESSPMDVKQEDWGVVTSPESGKEMDKYVINVTDGEKVDFKWKAKNYTARVHIGQVNVYYETSWNSSGILRLHRIENESAGQNETWGEGKTFHNDGKVTYHFRADKSDLPRFFKRASVIIEGGNPYEEVRTGPPPLIHFFFIPPTILAPSLEYGGYFLSFYIYFSLFILIDSLMMFYLFKKWSEDKALLSSLLFIANPI